MRLLDWDRSLPIHSALSVGWMNRIPECKCCSLQTIGKADLSLAIEPSSDETDHIHIHKYINIEINIQILNIPHIYIYKYTVIHLYPAYIVSPLSRLVSTDGALCGQTTGMWNNKSVMMLRFARTFLYYLLVGGPGGHISQALERTDWPAGKVHAAP